MQNSNNRNSNNSNIGDEICYGIVKAAMSLTAFWFVALTTLSLVSAYNGDSSPTKKLVEGYEAAAKVAKYEREKAESQPTRFVREQYQVLSK